MKHRADASGPSLLVVGAMKCGTSALHALLDRHPEVAMASGKELNFFFGPDRPPHDDPSEWWRDGQWHRGWGWYVAQLDPRARVRGESSPGYTDPSHPEVPARIHALLPEVRLVYLVRDPLQRAVSQWQHHVRDGTETRPVADALLDPGSQYVARSRYWDRISPYADLFAPEQLLVVIQERLRAHTDREVRRVLAHAGADPDRWEPVRPSRAPGRSAVPLPDGCAERFAELVGDDLAELRRCLGDELTEWPTCSLLAATHRERASR
ncbi:sulfotransferase family protein [Nocardioides sp. URHA0020]|uniref:sulfotransferase family protein n=1 Tax=Nocardioides sp. URHA0020 TaxID=1380392 RepID=UPI00048C1EA2|nr:sulfotransferase [Nocardioides sp. URHA0020]